MTGRVREIDPETWARREHFERFRAFGRPHFSICAEVDLTAVVPEVRRRKISLNTLIIYVVARAANDVPELRQRIRGDRVVEHEVVHPASTVMAGEDLFTFAFFEFDLDFDAFATEVARATARAQEHPSLDDPPDRDDLLFMTAIPWVAFTSFEHPMTKDPDDSIPRLAWGRCRDSEGRHTMPLNLQIHHALGDGLHAGRFYERAAGYFGDPASFLG
jgi:chloramphenicol O-acetyltransferase type A